MNIATVLDVNFARTLNIFSRLTWLCNRFNTVIINGNNSYINAAASDDDEFTWAEVDRDYTLVVYNLTIAHYNRAIKNNMGNCFLYNVHFDSNKIDYWFAKDYGAVIFNVGYLVLVNCTFSGNYAYNHENDVLNVGDGIVYYNGIKVTKGYYGPIAYTEDLISLL